MCEAPQAQGGLWILFCDSERRRFRRPFNRGHSSHSWVHEVPWLLGEGWYQEAAPRGARAAWAHRGPDVNGETGQASASLRVGLRNERAEMPFAETGWARCRRCTWCA